MNTRVIKTLSATLISLCTLSAIGMHTAHAKPKTPNFIIMVGDDWGFSDIGAYGSEIATPNIDSLAKQGMKFANFHVASSCSPTRAMLLTGVDNHRNGVGNMRETIPQSHLGKAGYLTVLNHITPPLPLPGMEKVFLGKASDFFKGKILVSKDGDFISLPSGSKNVTIN